MARVILCATTYSDNKRSGTKKFRLSRLETWNTSFGPKTWHTTATALTSCPNRWLTGRLTFEGSSQTYDLTFSKNGAVSWSLSSGKSRTIQTACGE